MRGIYTQGEREYGPFLNLGGETLYAYTEAHCWLLALAINRLTEWPVVLLGEGPHVNKDGEYDGWSHVCVEMPNGELLDITGSESMETMVAHWGQGVLVDADPDILWRSSHYYYQPTEVEHENNWGTTLAIARELLSTL
jgi:hypothetical protein